MSATRPTFIESSLKVSRQHDNKYLDDSDMIATIVEPQKIQFREHVCSNFRKKTPKNVTNLTCT